MVQSGNWAFSPNARADAQKKAQLRLHLLVVRRNATKNPTTINI